MELLYVFQWNFLDVLMPLNNNGEKAAWDLELKPIFHLKLTDSIYTS